MADKVLVVDDEKLIVKGIKYSLEQDGMEVSCAYDGREALDLIKANNYDIILLDVMLPEMDGYTVCQQVREFSDVPIIMITAKSEDMDKTMSSEQSRSRSASVVRRIASLALRPASIASPISAAVGTRPSSEA